MKEIVKGIWTWAWLSEEKGYNFNGTIVQVGTLRVLIDPVQANDKDTEWIEAQAPFEAIVLTNKDHERTANHWRQVTKAPVWIHEADAEFLKEKPDQTFSDGEELPCGLKAIHLSNQKSPGECALYLEKQKILILGDALIGHPAGSLRLLPPAKYADIKKAKASLQKLSQYDFELILVGDGMPIEEHAKNALADFLNSPGEPSIPMKQVI